MNYKEQVLREKIPSLMLNDTYLKDECKKVNEHLRRDLGPLKKITKVRFKV